FGVVRRPHVEGGESVDAAGVDDREVVGDLRPGPDPNAVRLRHRGARDEAVHRRLAVAPHALLERAAQLGLVGLAHQIARLVVESRIQEEPLVREAEGSVRLRRGAATDREELLTFRQGADGDRPFFESDWHELMRGTASTWSRSRPSAASRRVKDTKPERKSQIACKSGGFSEGPD